MWQSGTTCGSQFSFPCVGSRNCTQACKCLCPWSHLPGLGFFKLTHNSPHLWGHCDSSLVRSVAILLWELVHCLTHLALCDHENSQICAANTNYCCKAPLGRCSCRCVFTPGAHTCCPPRPAQNPLPSSGHVSCFRAYVSELVMMFVLLGQCLSLGPTTSQMNRFSLFLFRVGLMLSRLVLNSLRTNWNF